MNLNFIDEPELQFGTSKHIDIKFGIMNYGVLDFDKEDALIRGANRFYEKPITIDKVKELFDLIQR